MIDEVQTVAELQVHLTWTPTATQNEKGQFHPGFKINGSLGPVYYWENSFPTKEEALDFASAKLEAPRFAAQKIANYFLVKRL